MRTFFLFILVLVLGLSACNRKTDYLFNGEPVLVPQTQFVKPPSCYITASSSAVDLGEDIKFTLHTDGIVTEARLGQVEETHAPKKIELLQMGEFVGVHQMRGKVSGPGGSQECAVRYEIKDVPLDCAIEVDAPSSWMGDSLTVTLNAGGKVKSAEIEGKKVPFPVGEMVLKVNSVGTFQVHGKVFGPVTKTATCETTYKVADPTVTCSLSANPPAFALGKTTQLVLSATGPVQNAEINGKGVGFPKGQIKVTPSSIGIFKANGYVKGPRGESRCDANYKAREVVNFAKEVKHKYTAPVDILWVIDNSQSMETHQESVATNTELFLKEFENWSADWKMGLISTSDYENPFVGFTASDQLNYKTPDYATVFKDAVKKLGINGSGTEKPFSSEMKALEKYKDFLRPDAVFATIYVTDAPEQSRIPAVKMLDFLTKQKGDQEFVKVYGALGAQDFKCPQSDDQWNYKGSVFETLITTTQGSVFPLCTPDFGKGMADVSKKIINAAKKTRVIPLPKQPALGTIEVTYKGKVLPEGPLPNFWIYDAAKNAVVLNNLDFAPGEEEQVEVTFEAE